MRTILRPFALWLAVWLAAPAPAPGQQPSGERAGAQEALRVFLDCANFFCDFDHIRRELQFVSWVRDRRDADVHVLGTSRRTGGGGREYTLTFIGQRTFAGREDTLRYVARDTDTEDEVRRGLTRVLGLGLVSFAAKTPAAEGLRVSYQPRAEAAAQPAADPWDFWVFRARVSGNFNGEEVFSFTNASVWLTANRTTEALKINLAAGGSYSRQSYDLGGPDRFVTIQRGYDLNGLVVWSLGPHWSTGVRASASSSTFLNQDLAVRGGPALEYNLFSYDESTRRQLTFLYSVGVAGFDYEQETIFDRTSEVLGTHSLQVAVSVKQPWGTVNASAEALEYLHDLAKHRLTLSGGVNLRVFRGLELNVFGQAARIKDQLYLSKAGLSPEEILVRRRQLGTDFQYFASVGLSYRFGSIFNNVVNPRFEGGGPIFVIFR